MNGSTTIACIPRLQESLSSLMQYCKENNWAGFDPYDALNSNVYAKSPFYNNRICSVALTQIMKRMPVNLRHLLLVPKEQNPKAMALFLSALLKIPTSMATEKDDQVRQMAERLVALRSPDMDYWCWGYSFPWQTRTIRVPRGTPNLVCTTFVAGALLDAYEKYGEKQWLDMATGAAEYILDELFWTKGDSVAGFSYPLPIIRGHVHNANFLGAALFCRVHRLTGEKKFLEPAMRVARYSTAKQHEDGSWDYGELPTQRWVDNFHTGFNLCALRIIGQATGTVEFEPVIRRGFEFYKKHFFREDGAPRYFHDRTYPIDAHSAAQSIITLVALKDLDEESVPLALRVFEWTMKNMWHKQGYFFYQVLPFYKNKISYMRWSQAWMFLALSTLLEESGQKP